MEKLTEILADYSLSYSIDGARVEAVENARKFFKDGFGCMLAGANEIPVKIAREYGLGLGSSPVSTVFGVPNARADPETVALINGTAAHIHDYDDVSITAMGHPTVVMLPTVLAVGEKLGASGKAVLEAYMTGVEVMGLMGKGFNPEHYSRGWHNTATLGVFGATAAAGKIMGLSRERLTNAFGVAASRSSGLKGNFGTMTKSLHAGMTAASGIFAARIAGLGFGANLDVFEVDGGFSRVTTGVCHIEAVKERVLSGETEFLNPGLACKPFPSCKATHNGVNAAMDLKKENSFAVDEIDDIAVECQPIAKDLLKYPKARTPLQGKFSMNYCIACALLNDGVSLSDFEGTEITDERLLALMDRIHMEVDDEIAGGEYCNGTWETGVSIRLKNGKRVYKRIRYATGDPENPLSEDRLNEKFRDCISRVIDLNGAEKLLRDIERVDELPSIAAIAADALESYK